MFTKQAVGYINFRVIDLDGNSSRLVQNRYASISCLKKTIESLKNRNTKKMALGSEYDKKTILIEIENICVVSEYGKYLSTLYGSKEMKILYGKKIATVLKEEKVIEVVCNKNLSVENIESNTPLSIDRATTKKRYDLLCTDGTKEVKVKKERKTTAKGEEHFSKRLEGVVEFAKKNSLYFKKSEYKNSHNEIEWCCSKCGTTFNSSLYKLKSRKYPCKHCGVKEYTNGARALKNLEEFALSNHLKVKSSNYDEELSALCRLWWTCSHKEKELLSLQTIKRRIKIHGDKCPLCQKLIKKEED